MVLPYPVPYPTWHFFRPPPSHWRGWLYLWAQRPYGRLTTLHAAFYNKQNTSPRARQTICPDRQIIPFFPPLSLSKIAILRPTTAHAHSTTHKPPISFPLTTPTHETDPPVRGTGGHSGLPHGGGGDRGRLPVRSLVSLCHV